jgi:hypothetical protein
VLGDSPGFKQQNSCSALFCKQKWDCRVVCWFDATRNQRNKFKTCIYPCKWRDYQQSENHRMVQVQSWNSSKHTMIKLIFPYNEKCIQKIYTWINNLNIKNIYIYIYTWGKTNNPMPTTSHPLQLPTSTPNNRENSPSHPNQSFTSCSPSCVLKPQKKTHVLLMVPFHKPTIFYDKISIFHVQIVVLP